MRPRFKEQGCFFQDVGIVPVTRYPLFVILAYPRMHQTVQSFQLLYIIKHSAAQVSTVQAPILMERQFSEFFLDLLHEYSIGGH